jgi:hypothetical protein
VLVAKAKHLGERWKDEPEEHDFPAAADYLSLGFPESVAATIVDALREAPTMHWKARDLLRAARLGLLASDDPEVARDLQKVARREALSPVLLVRGTPLIVADGHHRICASYHLDENADIPCRLVDLP